MINKLIKGIFTLVSLVVIIISDSILGLASNYQVNGYAGSTYFWGNINVEDNIAQAYLDTNCIADLKIEGYALTEDRKYYLLGAGYQTTSIGCSRTTSDKFCYGEADFEVSSDDGYNKIYANVYN